MVCGEILDHFSNNVTSENKYLTEIEKRKEIESNKTYL